jgi:hypothetical protein
MRGSGGSRRTAQLFAGTTIMKRLALATVLLKLTHQAAATVPYGSVLAPEQTQCPAGYTPSVPSYLWSEEQGRFILEGLACRSIYRSPTNPV